MSLPSSASTRRGRLSRTWASATETGLQGRGPMVTRRCSPRVTCGLGRHTVAALHGSQLRWLAVLLHCCCLVAKCVPLFATPRTEARQASRSFTISQSLLKLLSIESVMPSNHLMLSSPSPTFSLSQHHGLFQCVSFSHQVPKYWGFSISPSNEHPGLISFRTDGFDLFAVEGTFKSLLQHHSSKASVLQCSAFFMLPITPSLNAYQFPPGPWGSGAV